MESRRTFMRSLSAVSVGGGAVMLGGCDESHPFAHLLGSGEAVDFEPTESAGIDQTSHVLNRLTFGARPGDYQRVKGLGVEGFIEEQLEPNGIADSLANYQTMSIETLVLPMAEMYEFDHRRLLADLTQYKMLRAVYSNRQLYEVMVDFWTDHFNIVSEKGDCRWLKAGDDREVIRKHALGNFGDLLRASALSPAMLIYLDGHDNKVSEAGDRPNENYARELLELHTMGVNSGYTQDDIVNLARCLSGWTYANKPLQFRATEVTFQSRHHDDGYKTLLGVEIPVGRGSSDLNIALDILVGHRATAKYLATKLCRRFIADEPPAEAVEVVANAFAESKGDIAETLRALFGTDAFLNDEVYRGNLFKRPQRFIVSALRATGANTDGGKSIGQMLGRMGQAPFQYPTPDGYPIEAGPWLGTLLWRWKFALGLQRQKIKGTRIDPKGLRKQFESHEKMAAHFLGRRANEVELAELGDSEEVAGLLMASPGFQVY